MHRGLALGMTLLLGCGPTKGTPYPTSTPADEVPADGPQGEPTSRLHFDWVSPQLQEHPLVGAIWSVDEAALIDEAKLIDALQPAQHVLLGETHDNPDHHRLQARYLEASASGRSLVAWEMIERDLGEERRAALAAAETPEEIEVVLDWSHSGWPDFAIYQPVFDAAMKAGLALRGGGLTREDLAPLFSGGEVDPQLREDFGLDDPIEAQIERLWIDELFDAHCGAMPREALGPMLLAQRLRDAAMTQAVLQAERSVLIAGSGHVRRDRAVPAMLARSGHTSVAVAFVEVQADEREVADYGELPYDYVVFTPRVERGDPCEAFAKGKGGKANP